MSPNARGPDGGVTGSQPMSTAVYMSPNKLWRSNSIFNLCMDPCRMYFKVVVGGGVEYYAQGANPENFAPFSPPAGGKKRSPNREV